MHILVLLYFAELSFLCCFRVESVNGFFSSSIRFLAMYIRHFLLSTNNFAHAQTLSRISSLSDHMNIARVNIELFTGCKKVKQRRISFVLGYLRMILWKMSTPISIKHRLLETFNIKKRFLSACMPLTEFIILSFLQSIGFIKESSFTSWTYSIPSP